MATLGVIWVKQGKKQWEDWWVQRHGQRLEQMPGLKDHIGFANYDLQQNGFARLTVMESGLELRDVSPSLIPKAVQILRYHGFEVTSSP